MSGAGIGALIARTIAELAAVRVAMANNKEGEGRLDPDGPRWQTCHCGIGRPLTTSTSGRGGARSSLAQRRSAAPTV